MTLNSVPSIRLTRIIKASPQRVFDLWTQPQLMARWLSPYPGEVRCVARAELRVGGRFKLEMRSDQSGCEIEGAYVAIDPPRKLVFTWSGPPTGQADTLVTVELMPIENATELTLTHEKLPTADLREGHGIGWAYMLDHLERAVF
ncbi:MAG TPA: SRPBCC domain-containing protein [Bradyrhizobium sp.]|nr:SRPBCC domain-containing protein [Bradyrhizobium sp.]